VLADGIRLLARFFRFFRHTLQVDVVWRSLVLPMSHYARSLLIVLPLALSACAAPSVDPQVQVVPTTIIAPTAVPATLIPTLPPVSAASSLSGLSYSGDVRAKSQVAIIPKVAGQVVALNVAVGDSVAAGDVLVELDHEVLDAQVGQAEAGLSAAQAMVRQAEAGLGAAQANLRRAEDGLTAGERQAASKGLEAAQAAVDRIHAGPTEEDLAPLAAQLGQAEAAVRLAQAQYDQVKDAPYIGMLPQSIQLEQATLGYQAAKALYEKAAKGATSDQVKAAEAQLAQARAANQQAQEGAPQSTLDAARAGVQQAEAAIAAAQAQVAQAESAVSLTRLQRGYAAIAAPIAGSIAQVATSVGSLASPQSPQPLLVLVSPDVEVVFGVEEGALPDVAVGDSVLIAVDAYPEQTFTGKIVRIAPVVNPATRTVEVTAVPEDAGHLLRPGMFATVDLMEG
jgi:multidrug efflux pump subunit AcrA (membrane-fusion protein)